MYLFVYHPTFFLEITKLKKGFPFKKFSVL